MKVRIRIGVCGFFLAWSSMSAAIEVDHDQPKEVEAAPFALEKGASEWGLLAGAGVAHPIWGGLGDRQFLALGGRLGRILTNPFGAGPLKGQLGVSLEVLPSFLMFEEETSYGASFTLLFRHYVITSSRWRPFISFGAGALFSTHPIPPGTTRVNFTPQLGAGVAFAHNARTLLFWEYRLHHISNAEIADYNPGINSSYLQFGVSVFR